MTVLESEVNIPTPDGTADAFFAHPAEGSAPGVLMWTDIFGLRASFRGMAKRLAESGYAVLVVNPFYRLQKAPTAVNGTATPIETLRPLGGTLNATTQTTDARAFIAWLDAQDSVAKDRKIGAVGYCMGGSISVRTAIAVPERVGAAACFHGGRLVTEEHSSPHLHVAGTQAHYLILIASNDDEKQPDVKDVLKTTFAKANMQAEVEVCADGLHGWCVTDSKVYNEAPAEMAWTRGIPKLASDQRFIARAGSRPRNQRFQHQRAPVVPVHSGLSTRDAARKLGCRNDELRCRDQIG